MTPTQRLLATLGPALLTGNGAALAMRFLVFPERSQEPVFIFTWCLLALVVSFAVVFLILHRLVPKAKEGPRPL